MRFDSGEAFTYATNSQAGTCSFNFTCSTRAIQIKDMNAYSDLSNAVITIQGSGTTLWTMKLGSAGMNWPIGGLVIDNNTANTLSANITGTSDAWLSISGIYRYL
jgi:hypothetical protein